MRAATDCIVLWRCAWLAGVWLCSSRRASAQIRVISPESLVTSFNDTKGRIEGSTATFGAPFYGDKVLGVLVHGVSKRGKFHCTMDDYDLPKGKISDGKGLLSKSELITIALVTRGECSFAEKVKIASKKGAHAVILVDKEDSPLNRNDMWRIVISDHGEGSDVTIPSILIPHEDGAKLLAASQKPELVIVELSWEVPTNHVVTMDFWMSSASPQSLRFLEAFAKRRKALNSVVAFQPHYWVFSMPPNSAANTRMCTDATGAYCTDDPDSSNSKLTGKIVLEEDVRQLCIHQLSKVPRTSVLSKRAGHDIEYAEKYWEYMSQVVNKCPVHGEALFGKACSEGVMQEIGLNVQEVNECILTTQDAKLHHEREDTAWSPTAVRINGYRYNGMLDADLVTRALCSGFIEAPPECTFDHGEDGLLGDFSEVRKSFSVGNVVLLLLVSISFAGFVICLYKRHLRVTMRQEISLEVQAQLSLYKQLNN
eukprot:TRINITY_DN2572_c0_g1_i1.p1 TRINITY_DN2572_c0_g1~~TRINITY_DN2572_c0_g1_i1.p1  ORF type:complete len:490 (-),score=74.10 TRINITY_DN2572_c0_g1_i1:196-1641(-)